VPYEIGFAPKGRREVSITRLLTARGAAKIVDGLERSDEEIRFIKTPDGQEIEIAELQLLAAREADAAPGRIPK
jgi:hypothetical protein